MKYNQARHVMNTIYIKWVANITLNGTVTVADRYTTIRARHLKTRITSARLVCIAASVARSPFPSRRYLPREIPAPPVSVAAC